MISKEKRKNFKVLKVLRFSLAYLKIKNMIYFSLEIHMENQMNVGENTQQVGQNPVNQQVMTPEKPKTNYLLIGGIVLACFVIFGFGGYYIGKQSSSSSTTSQIDISKSNETGMPTQTTYPAASQVISTESIYTYNSFSFTYPKTWTLFDTTSNKEFFTKNRLDGFERGIILEKGDYLLFIGVNKYASGGEAGGIFVTDTEFQEWKNNSDELTILGKQFYLWKNHTPLATLTDPGTHGGIFGIASLSEYILNKTTNEQNRTFSGWEDYIQNKNGYSYIFVKLSKTGSGNPVTPASVQSELQYILETIKW